MADNPTPTKKPQSDVLPLPAEGAHSFGAWNSRIEAAKDEIRRLKTEWDENIDRYLLKGRKRDGEVIVPKDFAFVEQKKAQLFFQTPQVLVEAALPGLEGAAPVFEAVINYQLGRNGVNASATVDEVLSDALCPSGIFAVKVGFEAVVDGTKQVQVGEQPDPNWKPSVRDLLASQVFGTPPPQPPMVPVMQDVPNIISQKYIFDRISPPNLLLPHGFTSSDFDKAPWIGFKFQMDFAIAKRVFKLPDDFSAFASDDEDRLGRHDAESDGAGKLKKVEGYEIYYKASIFDPNVKHPDKQRLLVIVKGIDHPVVHRDSPYQQQLPDGTIGGMPGFPVHVGTLRYVSDHMIPPSDASMTKYQVEELSKGRTYMALQRERSIPIRLGDLSALGKDGLTKIEKGIWQSIIPVENLDPNVDPIRVVSLAHYPNENFTFDNVASRDLEDVWALGANPTGALNATNRTATELAYAQGNSGTRLGKERNKFLDWFVRGVEKLAALIQMFADEQQYITIVGDDGQKRIQQWDKTLIQGKYAFKIKPNSSAPKDAAQERADFLQFYNLMAQSPFVNRQELESELVRKFDLDPVKLIRVPEPPPPPPKDTRVSVSIDENCLTPNHPGFPVFIEILKAQGYQFPDFVLQAAAAAAAKLAEQTGLPVAVTPPEPPPQGPGPEGPGPQGMPGAPGDGPHPPAQQVEPIDKHQMERTGDRPGPKIGGLADFEN